MVKITGVEKRSLADKHGIKKDDILISINGNEINDVLDYRFYLAEKRIVLLLLRGSFNADNRRHGKSDDHIKAAYCYRAQYVRHIGVLSGAPDHRQSKNHLPER